MQIVYGAEALCVRQNCHEVIGSDLAKRESCFSELHCENLGAIVHTVVTINLWWMMYEFFVDAKSLSGCAIFQFYRIVDPIFSKLVRLPTLSDNDRHARHTFSRTESEVKIPRSRNKSTLGPDVAQLATNMLRADACAPRPS